MSKSLPALWYDENHQRFDRASIIRHISGLTGQIHDISLIVRDDAGLMPITTEAKFVVLTANMVSARQEDSKSIGLKFN